MNTCHNHAKGFVAFGFGVIAHGMDVLADFSSAYRAAKSAIEVHRARRGQGEDGRKGREERVVHTHHAHCIAGEMALEPRLVDDDRRGREDDPASSPLVEPRAGDTFPRTRTRTSITTPRPDSGVSMC